MQVPVALLLIQLPANAPGEAGEDDPSVWAFATLVQDQDGVYGSRVESG